MTFNQRKAYIVSVIWKDIQYKIRLAISIIAYAFLVAFIVAIIAYVVWLFSNKSFTWALVSFLIVGLPLVIWLVYKTAGWLNKLKERKETLEHQEKLKTEIDYRIGRALEIMDKLSLWYTDENEANRELVTSLNTMGYNAEYQPRLQDGSIADARVGDILIEGKLSPNKSEIDRLLGQLSGYAKLSNKIHIVIYGRISVYALFRILDEIRQYPIKIVLTALPHPHRDRHY